MTSVTDRLYQRDAYLRRFEATLLEAVPVPEGGGPAGGGGSLFDLILDRTAFYPTGGGQPADGGAIQGLPVLDVAEGDRGPVHRVRAAAGELPPPGERVRCEVECARESVCGVPRRQP